MNTKMLGMLAVAGTAIALLAFLNQPRPDADRDSMIGAPLMPGLKENLAQVTSVSLQTRDGLTTLERSKGGWVVVNRDRYPADFGKLADLLNALAESTILERKTSRPDNFNLLGVADVLSEGSEAILVTVGLAPEEQSVLIGKQATGLEGAYAREPGNNQVWLASALSVASSEPTVWLDPIILNIDAEHVTRVTHIASDGAELGALRDEETGDFLLPGLPEGAELQYPTVANNLARALVNVRIEDVRKRGADGWEDVARAEFVLDDGSRVTLQTVRTGAENWIRVDLAPAEVPSGAVATINVDRLAFYEYRVGTTVADQFAKSMSDMIKPDPADAE